MNPEPANPSPTPEVPSKPVDTPAPPKKSWWEKCKSSSPQVKAAIITVIAGIVIAFFNLGKTKDTAGGSNTAGGLNITASNISGSAIGGLNIAASNITASTIIHGHTVSITQAIQMITNIIPPDVLKQLPSEREKQYQAEVGSDFADYDKVMKRLRELAFPIVTNIVVTNLSLTNGLKPFDTNVLLRLYFREIQTPINNYLATTNFVHEFRQRYNEWVQLTNRMQVQEGLLELALAWQEKLTNGAIPSDPVILKANIETIKQAILNDGIGIIEGKLATAESDFQKWTTTNSFAKYLARYGR